jgi:hypothetical protein
MTINFEKSKIVQMVSGVAIMASFSLSIDGFAGIPLTPQDKMTTTIFDKSIIAGEVEHSTDGSLSLDAKGNAKFNYTGDIYSIETNAKTGELKEIDNKIGMIKGQAAFPLDFIMLTAGMNELMTMLAAGQNVQFPQMPPVVPWTCNHCEMTVGDSTYVSIVDALDPVNGNPDMIARFDQMLVGGAAGALEAMRLEGRAFTGVTPASFDPIGRTMSVRMAGCSAVVGVSGTHAGKMGTVCLNSTATFNVSGAHLDAGGHLTASAITAKGTSNCTVVLHKPTM